MWSLLGVLCVSVIGNALPITYSSNANTLQLLPSPQVQTSQGPVVGTVAADGDYFQFHGIPYADTTTGSHRFKAPLPPPLFTDVFIADRKDITCIHPSGNGFEGTEDCLVANIFTPSLEDDSSLPVMVWVQGSEFTRNNENEFSFKKLVEKDVIIVSLNYRKSIFGFLCLGTETAPGNAGLKDIIAGLRWVKQNIGNFGGNPDQITIFGHGTGAAVVDLVTLSPMADGLIQRAITQSGSALAPWAVSRDNLVSAVHIAEALGHTDISTVEELSEIFTRVTAPALTATISQLELTDNPLVFAPCVEREIEGVEPLLLNTPFEIISEGRFLQIPLMTGFVENEGTIRSGDIMDSSWLNQMQESFSKFLQPDLEFENDDEKNRVADDIKTFYFQDNPIPQSIQQSIRYHGDTMVMVSTIREARLRTESLTAPMYLYQFSYKGTLGKPFVGPIEVDGAAHSEELAYLFQETPEIIERNDITDRDLEVGDILIERWTNFAKTGNPTSETSEVVWQPFTIENPNYLHILDDAEESAEERALDTNLNNPHPEELDFWNEIYEEHFLDAQSNWDVVNREEESEEDIITETPDETDVTTPTPDEEEDITEDPDDQEITTPAPDSASTAVGYTFMIILAFAMLDKFHSTQILS